MLGGILLNCDIIGNFNYNNAGGGVYISGLTCVVSNCVIANNGVTNGWPSSPGREVHAGGMYFLNGTVVNCDFHGNGTFGDGAASGAMRISGGGNPTVRNSLFYDNYCKNVLNGAIRVYNAGGTIQNCTIASNRCAG
ncbi:MAG: hypothetical protein PHP98_02635, partial [Kiritimatiellae bacterium]|nr:hypothetical protein [Kiritimatiellia bacterium]